MRTDEKNLCALCLRPVFTSGTASAGCVSARDAFHFRLVLIWFIPWPKGWLSIVQGSVGGKWGVRARPAAILLAMLLFVPAAAFGDAGEFLPTIHSSGGDFELNMIGRADENTAGGTGTRSSDMYAFERLALFLNGYIYHPRFIQFLTRGSAGLSQERFENNRGGSFSETGQTDNYDLRTIILAEHPYKLTLYKRKITPLSPGQTSETRSTTAEQGVLFDYAKKPLSLKFSYNTGHTRSRVSSSEYRSERASGSYLIGPVTNSASYSHTDSSTSLGSHAADDYSSFGNIITLGDYFRLDSSLTDKRLIQNSPIAPTLITDTLSWWEQLNAALPWNFSTSASYRVQKDARTMEETATRPRDEQTSDTKGSNFTLAHKLYDSVRTSYTLGRTVNETSSGDAKSVTNAVNGVYTKKVPDGRITVGLQGSRSIIDQENAPLVLGEIYAAPLFGTFSLTRENVDLATISIRVLSDTGAFVDLARNTNYIAQPAGTTTVITIISLPPEIVAGHPAGTVYTFQASYSVTAATVEFETTTVGYTINLSLFNNLINPYYSLQRTTQEVLTGSIPGGAQDSVTTTVGVAVQKAPYVIVSEYRTTESDFMPSHSLRNTAEYSQKMSDTMDLSAKAQHTETVYGEGTLGTSGYTEHVSAFNILINKYIPRRDLNVSASGSYTLRRAMIKTEFYMLTGYLSWRLGTLSVDLGASLNQAVSTGAIGNQTLLSEYFFMNVSRKLF